MFSIAGLVTAGFVASRLSGLFMSMPAFGLPGIPVLVRILASLLLTVVISPTVPPVAVPPTVAGLVVGVATEVLTGTLIGGSVRIVFGALAMAGELMSSQMGHGSAAMFDPLTLTSQGPVGKLATLMATAVFLGTNMHHAMFLALGRSFEVVPPGQAVALAHVGLLWADLIGGAFLSGARLASPIVVLVFLIHCFVAVLTRLAPNMNIFFSLGFVLTVAAGEGMFYLAMPYILTVHQMLVLDVINGLPDIFRVMAGG